MESISCNLTFIVHNFLLCMKFLKQCKFILSVKTENWHFLSGFTLYLSHPHLLVFPLIAPWKNPVFLHNWEGENRLGLALTRGRLDWKGWGPAGCSRLWALSSHEQFLNPFSLPHPPAPVSVCLLLHSHPCNFPRAALKDKQQGLILSDCLESYFHRLLSCFALGLFFWFEFAFFLFPRFKNEARADGASQTHGQSALNSCSW